MMLDDVFGETNFRNEIVWAYRSGGASRKKSLPRKHDSILLYGKSDAFTIRPLTERQYLGKPFMGSKIDADGRHYVDTLLRDVIEGSLTVLDESGRPEEINCRPVLNVSVDRLGYPTQKPRGLLELLIRATTGPGDLVADLFCGSGTTLEAAARTGRDFVGADIGGHAIRTTRGRLIRCGVNFSVVDLGVTARLDRPGKSEEDILRAFGACKDARGVWRRDGERCEIGLPGMERAKLAGESAVTALFEALTRDCALKIEEAIAVGMRVRPILIPREIHDPCEYEELRWNGEPSFTIECISDGEALKIRLSNIKIDSEHVGLDEFVDSWAVDACWDGEGAMRPTWRSARGPKSERLCFEAVLPVGNATGCIGVLVVDVHGNVHRMRTEGRSVNERSVPMIRA